MGKQVVRIAVVGDVHDQWQVEAEERALKHLGVDLVLLVGDFGNEAVDVVRGVAQLNLPKAVVLGNHDAWYSASHWGMKQCPYDRTQEDRVQQQLDLLGKCHVGYSKLDFPQWELSVVGGRPFSWGGSTWKNAEFYRDRYGIRNFQESVDRIVTSAEQTRYETIIFLGHCGPLGLGETPEAPCGRDWQPLGGDFGDPDLAEAILGTRELGKTVPLVTFGHMHHNLRHTRQRQRTPLVAPADGTIYLNAASVPRVIQTETGSQRNFSLVTLEDGVVVMASLVWIDQDCHLVSEQILYQRVLETGSSVPIR